MRAIWLVLMALLLGWALPSLGESDPKAASAWPVSFRNGRPELPGQSRDMQWPLYRFAGQEFQRLASLHTPTITPRSKQAPTAKGPAKGVEPAVLTVSRPSQGVVMMRLRHGSLDHMAVRGVSIDSGLMVLSNQSLDARRLSENEVFLAVGFDETLTSLLRMPWKVTLAFEKFKGFGESDVVRVPIQPDFDGERFRLRSDSPLFKRLNEGWGMDPSTGTFRIARRVARIDDYVLRPQRVQWRGGETVFPVTDSDYERSESGPIPVEAKEVVLMANRCRYVVWRPIVVKVATEEPLVRK